MTTRGIVQVWVLYVIGAAAATQLVPNWRISALFAKGPQTAQLRAAEEAAAKARGDAALAEAHYNAAIADFEAKKGDQLRYSQQMLAGVKPALLRAPPSPEVTLASSLADRASKGLSSAIGDLPADRQAEIMAIVEGALSAKQAEVEAANAKLAAKDAELKQTTAAKVAIEAQLPILKQNADSLYAKAETANQLVISKTAEVVAFADKAAAELKENGSLRTTIEKYGTRALIAVALYFALHFFLPCLAQSYPGSKALAWLASAVKNTTTAHS